MEVTMVEQTKEEAKEEKKEEAKQEKKQEAKKEEKKEEAKEEKKEKAKEEKTEKAKEEKKEKEAPEVSKKLTKILDEIAQLSVLELSDFIKAFEEKFDVSAAAPVAVAAGAAGGEAPAEAEQAKSTYDVVLKEAGQSKMQVIKVIREITGLGLKDCKALVDAAPKAVKEGVDKDAMEEVKKKLEDAGATVDVK
jgi:large subunit ribosomal protein L7/L12